MPLYAFGSNGSGQLGVGHTDDLSFPTQCTFSQDDADHGYGEFTDVFTIAAGGNHTLVLFASGAVYAAGCNTNGRCGCDPEIAEELLSFKRVVLVDDGRAVDRFSAISATWEASFLVDAETGAMYVIGSGSKGELGLGQAVTETRLAARIPDFPPAGTAIVCLSSSGWHTVAVLSSGEVYGWGSARKGQLGPEGVQHKVYWHPTRVADVGFPARQAACGREFTVVTGESTEGESIIMGSDKWGIQSAAPKCLKGYAKVSASWHGVYIHNNDESLFAWGRNDRGQLPPPDIPNPSKLAVGSEHVLAVVGARRLVAFGWGEHGNCGPATDAQGNVSGRIADIPIDLEEDQKLDSVGAGCATSWVVIK